MSTIEAEYIAVECCCAQVLWMRQTLKDFGLSYSSTSILCDNSSAISLSKKPVHHSRTKHIEVRHHFLRDHELKNDIKIEFIPTNDQLADIFTKPIDEQQFIKIRRDLGICRIEDLI